MGMRKRLVKIIVAGGILVVFLFFASRYAAGPEGNVPDGTAPDYTASDATVSDLAVPQDGTQTAARSLGAAAVNVDSKESSEAAASGAATGNIDTPSGLRIFSVPFVYNSLYRLYDRDDPVHAVEVLKSFPYLVCAEPGRLAEKEIRVTEVVKSAVGIFGYVDVGGASLPPLEKIEAQIDRISRAGWYGVFIDQFGYDFGETRERQNRIVDYAHAKGLKCFVNCWHIEDAFGSDPNPEHNPAGLETHLEAGDWYLMESFWTQNGGYADSFDTVWEKAWKAREYKEKYGIRVITLSYKRDAAAWAESAADVKDAHTLSLFMGFDGWWFTDRLESDGFIHGEAPADEYGNILTRPFFQSAPGYYMAVTDRCLILLDVTVYPSIKTKILSRDFILKQPSAD